ncbi:PAS domain-containing sensor histidine kinase [Natronoflexus pectinivorans]|uniref:histidine kinase n=1 Tax=Natronoflexus pectinivorans TaxID=682526 RepID=A0A4R2GJU8_9BACT|nr:PAS domain S-box protein [Natronoflexus pectinivorans]TCO08324.1 PAS domain S-box-containing protein [Natronoflexus pectinivorans]
MFSDKKHTELFFNSVIEESTEGIVITDETGAVVVWNKQQEKNTGISRVEVKDRGIWDVYGKLNVSDYPSFKRIEKEFKEILKTGIITEQKIPEITLIQEEKPLIFQQKLSVINTADGFCLKIVWVNISRVHKLKHEIIEAQKSWEDIFNAIGHPTMLLSYDKRVIRANRALQKKTGKTEEELIGRVCQEFFHCGCTPEGCPFKMACENNEHVTSDMYIEAMNGVYIVSCTPVKDQTGQTKNILHIATDISSHKKIEDELNAAKYMFRSMIDKAPFGAHLYELLPDNSLIFTGTNQSADKVLGVDNSQFIGKTIEEAFPNLDDPDIPSIYRNVAISGEPCKLEQLHYSDDKGISGAFEIWAFQTSPRKMAVLFHDITEKKKLEDMMHSRERRFKELIKNSSDIILVLDQEGNQIFVSDAVERILGFTAEELTGIPVIDKMIHPHDIDEVKRDFQKTIEEGFGVARYRHKHKNGGWIHLESWGSNQLQNPDINGVVFNVRDVTERKQIEMQLVDAKEKAEESDRLKTAFIQNMSHEIRTPMNAIMGFSSLLSEYFDEKESLTHFSDIINQSCFDLLSLINSLLDISKIESGQLNINKEPCNLDGHFQELSVFFSEYTRRINKEDVQLKFNVCQKLINQQINLDKVKVRQILINLISNGLKYTERGYVECGCSANVKTLSFYVKDTGVGIPPDKHDFIFERFSQLQSKTVYDAGGTGLGLSIVKGLVKLLGGKIWLESVPDQGSTFYVDLPLD